MTPFPKISLVVATLNRASYLKRMLDNLLQTDYPNLEIIVVDGGSNDGTVGLLKSYGDKITRWVSEPDRGEYDGFNKGLAMVTGEIIKPMTDDDVLRPQAFRLAADYFAAHPEVDIVFGGAWVWIEKNGKPTFESQMKPPDAARLTVRHFIRQTAGVLSPSVFIRRRVFERIGLFSAEYVAIDMEFWARAAASGLRLGVVPDLVLDYHYTGQNGVIKKAWRIKWDVLRINAKYGDPTDVLLSVYRHYLKWPLLSLLAMASHAVGLHPARIWRRWRGASADRPLG